MDPRHLGRLQQEQKKAISETEVKIEHIKRFKEDYKALHERLKTLPDKVTHDVMVPFGKFAFMPGQLVHTNEILVLLGDNWFVERSARQAVEIAGRRIQELDKKLKELEAQQKLLEPRRSFTSDLQAEIQGSGDIKEIVEEYEEAKEKLWDEQHRRNVKRYKEELKRNLESQDPQHKKGEDVVKTDSFLWSQLDELEKQEAERGEMDSASEEDIVKDSEKNHSTVGLDNSLADRRVNWADEVMDDKSSSSDDYTEDNEADSDDDDDSDIEAESMRRPVQKMITFSHSPTPSVLPHQVHEGEDSIIRSPADIYRLYSPKSILKKTVDSRGLSDSKDNTETNTSKLQSERSSGTTPDEGRAFSSTLDLENESESLHQSNSQQVISSTSSAHKAFTGFVVEKSHDLPTKASFTTTETSPSSVTTVASKGLPISTLDEQPKRVSKFRASRLSQNPS